MKWMESQIEERGHKWKSNPRDQDASTMRYRDVQAVRCRHCGLVVTSRGRVRSSAAGFGAGEKEKGRELREWIQEALPVCTSMEWVVRQVMTH